MKPIVTEYVNGAKVSEKINTRWWLSDEKTLYQDLFATVSLLETRQNYRTAANITHARLYSDLEQVGLYAGLYSSGYTQAVQPNRIALNVIRSCVDTVTSKIAKAKTRPMFLTEGGNWNLQQRAKSLTKFIDGQFDAMNHYEVKQDTFRDGAVFGTGFPKFYIDKQRKQICSERVIPEEILVDDAEAIYGAPRTLYQRRLVNKDVLCEQFPKHSELIRGASNGLQGAADSIATRDLVKVIEAWHLPSGPNAKDGRHVICVDTVTLEKNLWSFEWFPFSKETWQKALVGYFGLGIPKEIMGVQIEINKILRRLQESMDLFAIPRVLVENGSQVNLAAINNDIGSIIKHTGNNAPQFYTPQAMSPDVYAHLWNLYGKAFEITGVSQLSAASSKPEGLDSGRALREFQDIESDRFQIVAQRRESTFICDAKICVEFAKLLSKEEGDYKVKVSDQGSMKTIRWSEVDMSEEKYMMRVFPTSILPTQPAAKMQTIVEYTQAGFFDKDTAMDLMDFPDIEAATSRQIAPRRIVFKMLDEMVDSDVYQSPEPFMNLALTQSISQLYYLDAKQQGVPEKKLELIRRFMTDTATILQAAMPPPMPMGPGLPPEGAASPPVDPMAVPEPNPTSDLLPVA